MGTWGAGNGRWKGQVPRGQNPASCSESRGSQAEPLGTFVCAHSRVGSLHVWRQPGFPTRYFLFPLSLSPAPRSLCSTHRPAKAGSSHLETPEDTSQKTNRTEAAAPHAAEVTPSVGLPQSLPAKDGAGSAPASLCPLGSGSRPCAPNPPGACSSPY